MHFLSRAFTISLCLWASANADDSVNITGIPSPGNFIIKEESSSDLSWHDGTIAVSSNVPVTVQRYSDDQFMEGAQPVRSNYAHVLVTSDCAATTYVPTVTWGEDSIDVSVQGAPSSGLTHLDSSSYRAEWSHESHWCRWQQHRRTQSPRPSPATRLGEGRASSLRSALANSFEKLVEGPKPSQETGKEQTEARRYLASSSGTSSCTVNVEVMVDGCSKSVDVSAPSVRVVDSTIENTEYESSSADPCVTDMSTDIAFDGQARRNRRNRVRKVECHRAVPGRPFVDSSGKALQASQLIMSTTSTGEGIESVDDSTKLVESSPSTFDNSTNNRLLLGQEWTKNALGEHASVASFSAFSIALMTNGAPSDLVQGAIEAALDETRHAEASFAIASRLTGREVGPGPLPESSLTFERDLTKLALAVAREGCIDETLSALEAAAEVEYMDTLLANGNESLDTKYSGIDEPTLAWIREELSTIASEERTHAVLAWRTIEWVCRIDSGACDIVRKDVLNEDSLKKAFWNRFGSFEGASDALVQLEGQFLSQLVDASVCLDSGDIDSCL